MPFFLYSQIKSIRAELKARIRENKKELKSLPRGDLRTYPDGPRKWKWYDGRKPLSKKEPDKAMALSRRKYLELTIREDEEDLAICNSLMEESKSTDSVSALFNKYPEMDRLHKAFMEEKHKDWDAWGMADYERDRVFEESARYMSDKGDWVRSKAELAIANWLFARGISYRYEPRMVANGNVYYPDFLIMHPQTGREYILEYFGLCSNDEYLEHNAKKLKDYAKAGILINRTLLVASESEDEPMDYERLTDMLTYFFLLDEKEIKYLSEKKREAISQ